MLVLFVEEVGVGEEVLGGSVLLGGLFLESFLGEVEGVLGLGVDEGEEPGESCEGVGVALVGVLGEGVGVLGGLLHVVASLLGHAELVECVGEHALDEGVVGVLDEEFLGDGDGLEVLLAGVGAVELVGA